HEPSATELAERDRRISEAQPTHVWVGLGTPKQDYEVQRIAANLPVVALAVGAAFDFLAGTKAQAPAWMQRNGLEWAYRFAKEPKRLAKRYVWGNSVFSLEAARTLRETGQLSRSRSH
ncbi:MAG TPA: WecB/TagA/CpsF family glycosyltransferase, partial [Acidimicrobiia bacterium]